MALTVLAAGHAIDRWTWLAERPWPLDYNGFYYLQEVAHRLEHGEGYYHGVAPFFTALAGFVRLAPLAPPEALDLWIWLGVLAFSAALVAARSPGLPLWTAPAVVVLVWGSDALFYAHYAFVRQATAMALLAFGLAVLERAGLERLDARAWIGAGLIWVAGIFHLFAAVVGLAWLVARRLSPVRLTALAAPLLPLVVAGVADKVREFGAIPVRAGPLAWDVARRRGWMSPYEYLEYPVYAAFAVALLVVAWRSRPGRPVLFWLSAFGSLAFVLPVWDVSGLGQRLFLSSTWLFLLAVAAFPSARSLSLGLLAALVACQTALGLLAPDVPRPVGPAMRVEPLLRAAPALEAWLPPDAHVLAPNGVQFRVTYLTGRASSQSPPRDHVGPRYVLRLELDPEPPCPPVEAAVDAPGDVDCVEIGEGWIVERAERAPPPGP